MEFDMVVSILKKEETSKIRVLALDNDSTTCSRLKEEEPRKIKDIKDMNHMKKKLILSSLQVSGICKPS